MSSLPTSYNNPIIESARAIIIRDILTTGKTSACWDTWFPLVRAHFGSAPTAEGILSLGDKLSEIFLSTRGIGGRGPSEVSSAGAAWESLVCYYLNLCLAGSSAVVFRKRTQVPAAVRDALTVQYRSVRANTESDMVAITFPEEDADLWKPLEQGEKLGKRLSIIADKKFSSISVAVVQCKTNWNENAQIPMLWDMVYNTKSFRDPRIEVGINSRDLRALKYFAYAFMTVPTNPLHKFKPTVLAARRVNELSGGNYWGRPTLSGVARSAREIFTGARIGPVDGKGIRTILDTTAPSLDTDYSYFGL